MYPAVVIFLGSSQVEYRVVLVMLRGDSDCLGGLEASLIQTGVVPGAVLESCPDADLCALGSFQMPVLSVL